VSYGKSPVTAKEVREALLDLAENGKALHR
jgi:hypothetical protein